VSRRSAGTVSVYDRLRHSDAELCALLVGGTARRELIAMFGAGEYALLTALARQAQRARLRHAEPVYLLPGIMGTQLGATRTAPTPADLLWLDPLDIIGGGLARLRLPDCAALITLGAIQYSYLALQLRLRAAGFAVVVHEYDWRADLAGLAAELASRMRDDPAPGIHVVAHSMGGMIARRALSEPGLERVRRLITLGTPHGGSFGAVQALRGTYPVVRRLAALDQVHDAESLAANVFSTFPSIHQMLPTRLSSESEDLYAIEHWPRSGPRPDAQLLRQARAFAATLPAADARCITISGTHQRTVTSLRLVNDEFHYAVSDAGDGTVPLERAQLAGHDNYFVRCEHSTLPRSATVARALVELLRHGRTTRLASAAGAPLGRHVTVSDSQLRGTWNGKVAWHRLAPAARRDYLNRLNQPPPQYAARRVRRRA
jgi:pimeloyl-ACP methyl ester carboxylesterase